jgi:hypothetical protein
MASVVQTRCNLAAIRPEKARDGCLDDGARKVGYSSIAVDPKPALSIPVLRECEGAMGKGRREEALSWIENVIVPSLVDRFIQEKVLAAGEDRRA